VALHRFPRVPRQRRLARSKTQGKLERALLLFDFMTTLKDFISPEMKKIAVALFAFLVLCAAGSDLYKAFRIGVTQRLPSTPKYTRSENPVMFWLVVVFFGAVVILSAGLLIAVIVHWHDEKAF
jgi:hypothetical protein